MNALDTTTPIRRCLGIRAKIVLPLAGVAVAVAVAGVALIRHAQMDQSHRYVEDRASAIAHSVRHVAKTIRDPEQLRRIVAAMAHEHGVQLIAVVAGDPLTVVASSRCEWRGQTIRELRATCPAASSLVVAAAAYRAGRAVRDHSNDTLDYALTLRTPLPQGDAITWSAGAMILRIDSSGIRREQDAVTALLIAVLLATIAVASMATGVVLKQS
jgi:hypothetical protein